ncbi:MAG TPA: protein kinase [Steroidobacteraceae bacterium]|nr:protein kinase [Steroidobacteraceae bacterium]
MTTSASAQPTPLSEASQSLPGTGVGTLPLPLRLLIVADDVAIRLHLADLLAPHCGGAVINTAGLRGAVDLGAKLKDYAAAIVIVDLATAKTGGQPLAIVGELRAISRALVVTVLGRGGHERSAIDALRAGASDYWPLHTVNFQELVATLRTHLVGSRHAAVSPAEQGPPPIAGYRPIKELCRSGRATLYLAHSDEVGEAVALKVHTHRHVDGVSDVERERFMRECRLLAQMNHRSIADVYDFGITPECHWLALEYFPCGSLKARLAHPLTEAEALGYVRQIAEALGAIHAAGIVHRDLKPSNVMLRADDSLALIDFGLARPALRDSSVTGRNVRVGSPSYMAPEQIEGLPPDHRCDLYALGVLFHELLTGALPFNAETVPEILALHLRARPPRLPPRVAHYQPLIDSLLAKLPPDRPASAAAFLDALATASATPLERRPS